MLSVAFLPDGFRKCSIWHARLPPCNFACIWLFCFWCTWPSLLHFLDLPTCASFVTLPCRSPLPAKSLGCTLNCTIFCIYLFILIAQILCALSVSSFPFDSNCPKQLDAFWSEIDLAIFYQGAEQRASAEICDGAAGEISIIAWR